MVGGTPEAEQRVCIPPGRPHTFWNARNTTELDMGAHPASTQTALLLASAAGANLPPVCQLTSDPIHVAGDVQRCPWSRH